MLGGDYDDRQGTAIPARVLIDQQITKLGLKRKEVSLAIGMSHSYISQYIIRGSPKVLPEHIREALAPVLKLRPEQLKEARPRAKHKRKPPEPSNPRETELLNVFRELAPELQDRAIAILKALR